MYKHLIRMSLCLLTGYSVTAQSPASSAYTTTDYGEMFASINTKAPATIAMSLDTFLSRKLPVKKMNSSFDFRQEYSRKVEERGLRSVSYIFDTDDDKPLYEIIYEFENADTLAALMETDMGPSNHPTLADHWILGKGANGAVSLLWYFNNKIVIAANLPHTELESDASFQLPDELFEPPAADVVPQDDPSGGDLNVQLNAYLTSAIVNDLDAVKGNAVEGKKDEFIATIPYAGAEQTLVRKNAAGKWRLEARRSFENMGDAKTYYDAELQRITGLEGLEYRLVRKAEYSTNTGNTYVWEVQTQDDQPLGVMIKIQLYAAGSGKFGVKMETGKE